MHKSFMAVVPLLLAFFLALTLALHAEAGYVAAQATEVVTTKPLAAGGVTGIVGALNGPDSSAGGGNSLSTSGSVGARWNGAQYEHADDGPKDGGVDVFHRYDHFGSGSATLTVDLSSSVLVSGSAAQWYEEQWWWNSHNSVIEDPVLVYVYVPGAGFQDLDVDWQLDTQCTAHGGDAGDAHATPPSSNNNGSWSWSTLDPSHNNVTTGRAVGQVEEDLPDVAGAYVVAQASWGAEAKGCVDNAVVSVDKLELTYTFTTSVN